MKKALIVTGGALLFNLSAAGKVTEVQAQSISSFVSEILNHKIQSHDVQLDYVKNIFPSISIGTTDIHPEQSFLLGADIDFIQTGSISEPFKNSLDETKDNDDVVPHDLGDSGEYNKNYSIQVEPQWNFYHFLAEKLPSENEKANEAISYNTQNNTSEDLQLFFELLTCPEICSIDEKYARVRDFQSSHGLLVDGKIGPQTLRVIYARLFLQQPDKLSMTQLSRLKYFRDMDTYPNWTRSVENVPEGYGRTTVTLVAGSDESQNAFKNHRFYTDANLPYMQTVDLKNDLQLLSVLDIDILPHVVSQIDELRPISYQFTHPELGAIMLTYVQGKLLQAQKVGLGKYKNPTPNMSRSSEDLPKWFANYVDTERLKYYLSGAQRVLKRRGYLRYSTAVMPYAVPINPNIGIYAHAGDITGLSSGCIRQSGIHAQTLFENYNTLGEMLWQVQGTRNTDLSDFIHLIVK